ncbi:hypothetical protein Val02_85960 [Virgisporangium aliadipatigenens]|uniref:Uncharacterized protein n=1 Tax=Virgisporangium aliadipatigenens TaxID=741659 RepID=A0A8J3YXV0_9ACTN|nr:hypothetical protein [Virgisporangium aliadipatigenens]GIJ51710.1 hypothetical protein Val02_85960 [Virgisporangium aliadipatigenens]
MTITGDVETRSGSQSALACRLSVAALGMGVVGGVATAALALSFGATGVSPVARILVTGLPLVLLVLIGRRLAADTVASDRWLGGTAVVGVVVTALVQAWPELGAFDDDPLSSSVATLGIMFYGGLFGLAVSLVAIVVGVPVILLLRGSRIRLSLTATHVVMTAVAMAVAAPFVYWVTDAMNAGIVTGMSTTLVGAGAAIVGQWCLMDRPA